jgi:glucose/arabinose dehydrogenase
MATVVKPGEIANDKIIVLRDTDGDGVADKRTVFADGLLILTGVLPDDRGLHNHKFVNE